MHTLTCTREVQKASLTREKNSAGDQLLLPDDVARPWHHRKTALSLDCSPLLRDPNTMLKGLGPSVSICSCILHMACDPDVYILDVACALGPSPSFLPVRAACTR